MQQESRNSPIPLTPVPECQNGIDDEGDGLKDYPKDPECSTYNDENESHSPPGPPECEDGLDNEGGGEVDYPADPDCTHERDDTEYPLCTLNGAHCDGIILHKDRGWLTGAIGDQPSACMNGRPILIKKQREGRDAIKTYDQSNPDGYFRVLIKDRWKGKFYAVGPKWNVPQSEDTCGRKISNIVRIR